ncbi:Rv3654c family TadE-like protein [Austwickia chelonae]|uniref:Rv3654c family TadE-like protein n=1 Tax=Austwickia chelonae TaxID=100225 RepID=UPI000E26C16C|nr:Rv3654c family TadE-like protein [Austwickia chelonae]
MTGRAEPGGQTETGREDLAEERAGEDGSASVLALGLIGVITVLLLAGSALASAVLAGHRAAAAADLSALAGAATLAITGDAGEACTRAELLARSNAAELVSCAVHGEDVAVSTSSAPSWPGLPEARARAQAGPAPESAESSHAEPTGGGGDPARA